MTKGYGPDWSASLRRGPEGELRRWIETAFDWCDETDAIAMAAFRAAPRRLRKADGTFVTAADTSIEACLVDRITETWPSHGIVGEELGDREGSSSVRWYVDPIDGTHNYLRGVPIFGTLLAIERDGELQGAIISAPALGERWHCWRGGGAWSTSLRDRRVRRIQVSEIAALADAHVLYSSTTDLAASGLVPGVARLLGQAWRTRGFGDFWGYTLVAEGAAEAMLEVGLKPWDAAAPFVLVEEAGGRVTDLNGRRTWAGESIVATNGLLHDVALETLSRGTEG